MGRARQDLEALGVSVLGIGGGSERGARWTRKGLGTPYPVLSDRSRATYASYGYARVAGLIQKSGTVLVQGPDPGRGRVRFLVRTLNPMRALPLTELLEAAAAL